MFEAGLYSLIVNTLLFVIEQLSLFIPLQHQNSG